MQVCSSNGNSSIFISQNALNKLDGKYLIEPSCDTLNKQFKLLPNISSAELYNTTSGSQTLFEKTLNSVMFP